MLWYDTRFGAQIFVFRLSYLQVIILSQLYRATVFMSILEVEYRRFKIMQVKISSMVKHTSKEYSGSMLQEQTREQVYTVKEVYGESFGISIRTVTIYRHKETGKYYMRDGLEENTTVVFKDEVNDKFSPEKHRLSLNGDVFSSFATAAEPFDGEVCIFSSTIQDMSNVYDKKKLERLQEFISK